jgi:peptidoglycan/xylan/chitin deacetylase (PgdA/CDA1 family)
MKSRMLFASLLALYGMTIHAAGFVWPPGADGNPRSAAIVLTYDDALKSQLDIAIPQLDAAKLPGTFFLDGDLSTEDMRRWRDVASRGHELGNHSMFHPCPRAMLPDRRNYLTDSYDVQRMLEEIASMNNVLFGIDTKTRRTFSVPCSQTLVGGADYTDPLRQSGLITAVRTGGDQWNSVVGDPAKLDLFRVPSHGPVKDPGASELIAYVERVRDARGLGVLQFHGVGGDYLDVSAATHQALIDYLRQRPDIWVGTFQEVMDHVRTQGATR